MGDFDRREMHEALLEANGFAARACSDWLAGVGLLSSLEEIARTASDVRLATPGAAELRAQLDDGAAEAVATADLLLSAASSASGMEPDRLDALGERCAVAAEQTAAATRGAAQLALGVTSHAAASDDVMRLERAAVLVLHGSPTSAADDDYELRSSDDDALRVEMAGLVARLLSETDTAARFRAPGRPEGVDLVVDGDANLAVFAEDGAMTTWMAPLTVSEVAADLAARLETWGVSPADVSVEVLDNPAVA